MEHLAEKLDIPLSRVYHLATFFRAFSLEPRGKHELHVCMGTACHVRGAPRILEALERKLKVRAGSTTRDQKYTLETVNCVGACALGPVVMVDGQAKGKLNIPKAERLLTQIEPVAVPAPKPAKSKKPKVKKKAAPKKRAKKPATKKKKAPPKKKVKKALAPKKKVKKASKKSRPVRAGKKASAARKKTKRSLKKARR
jgi:hypothetical protein